MRVDYLIESVGRVIGIVSSIPKVKDKVGIITRGLDFL